MTESEVRAELESVRVRMAEMESVFEAITADAAAKTIDYYAMTVKILAPRKALLLEILNDAGADLQQLYATRQEFSAGMLASRKPAVRRARPHLFPAHMAIAQAFARLVPF